MEINLNRILPTFFLTGCCLLAMYYFLELPKKVESLMLYTSMGIFAFNLLLRAGNFVGLIKNKGPKTSENKKEYTALERYERLSHYYMMLRDQVMANMLQLKKDSVSLKRMNIEIAPDFLAYTKGTQKLTVMIGEINENLAFDPSVTGKIIHTHRNIEYINMLIDTKKTFDKSDEAVLQSIVVDCLYFTALFDYIRKKISLINGDPKALQEKSEEHRALFENFMAFFKYALNETIKPLNDVLDVEALNQQIKQYRFKDYSTMEFEYTSEGRIIDYYPLPKDYAEPLLKNMALLQAEAMHAQQSQ